MREIRLSGSEGGGGHRASPYPYGNFRRLRRHDAAVPLCRCAAMTLT